MPQSSEKRLYVVGIAGGSASGKSTFAAALQRTLESSDPPAATLILSMDRYSRHGENDAPHFVYSGTGEAMFDWNRPESFDIQRLAADIDIAGQAADAPAVLIVEGLMALHAPQIRQRLDLCLFVDLDADVRALRRMLRNISPERGSQAAELIAGYYRESARVGHTLYVEPSRAHADLIIRGDSDFDRVAALIGSIIANYVHL